MTDTATDIVATAIPPGLASRPRAPASALATLLLLAVIWGASIPISKWGLADIDPLSLTALRFLMAAPFALPFVMGRRVPPLRPLLAMLALGVLMSAVGQVFQNIGVSLTSASVATVIGATIPILFTVIASIRMGQALSRRHIAGLLSAFLGVVIVAIGNPMNIAAAVAGNGLLGDLVMLGSAVAVAAFYALSAEFSERYTSLAVTGWTTLGSALAMVPLMGWQLAVAPFHPTLRAVAVVAYLALLVTVAGSWIWFRALDHLPARVVAAIQYLQPLIGVALAAFLFGDRIDLWFGVGTLLVFIGIALASSRARRAVKEV